MEASRAQQPGAPTPLGMINKKFTEKLALTY